VRGEAGRFFAHVGLGGVGGRCVFLHHAGIRAVARRTVAGLIHIGEIYLLHRNDTGWVRGVCGSVDYNKDRHIISSQHAFNNNGPQLISSSFSFEVIIFTCTGCI
jgi:hypothetical protein